MSTAVRQPTSPGCGSASRSTAAAPPGRRSGSPEAASLTVDRRPGCCCPGRWRARGSGSRPAGARMRSPGSCTHKLDTVWRCRTFPAKALSRVDNDQLLPCDQCHQGCLAEDGNRHNEGREQHAQHSEGTLTRTRIPPQDRRDQKERGRRRKHMAGSSRPDYADSNRHHSHKMDCP